MAAKKWTKEFAEVGSIYLPVSVGPSGDCPALVKLLANSGSAVLKKLKGECSPKIGMPYSRKENFYLIDFRTKVFKMKALNVSLKSIVSDGDSIDRWSQILDDWLKNEGVKHDWGNDRQVQIGLNFIVTAGGGLYVKRTEFDLDADQISDIMVKTFMSTFLSIDESKISQTLVEAKSALQKYELTTLTQAINKMFDN